MQKRSSRSTEPTVFSIRYTESNRQTLPAVVVLRHICPHRQTVQKTLNDIHKLQYMYIVHVPCFVFFSFFGTIDVKNDLHCIIWSEQGHIFYILSLLRSDDAVICSDIVLKKNKNTKKTHLSIQAWVRVMLLSVCKYHPLVLSLSLCHMWHIVWLYGLLERKITNILKRRRLKHTLLLFGAFCEALLMLCLGCAEKRMRCISP